MSDRLIVVSTDCHAGLPIADYKPYVEARYHEMMDMAVPIQLEMMEHLVEHGRMFNELDDERALSVCVIGTGIRDELFGSREETGQDIIPLGETMTINGEPFTIIGMFQHYEG